MIEPAASEAIFGSASRGDSDALSDKDILIVDDNIETLKQRQQMLEFNGWSVASYTFKKLNFLARIGALFVQHLKSESKILSDLDGRLQKTLENFSPKVSYENELLQNSRLSNLVEIWPMTRNGALWAADVLYVTTRNFGILHLAQKKVYRFSYSQVLEALVDDGVITANALPHLFMLRLAKSLYRSRELISLEKAKDVVECAIDVLPREYFPIRSVGISPISLLQRAVVGGVADGPYYRLRNLERMYLALQELNPGCSGSEKLSALCKWIENPRAYASIAGRFESDLITELKFSVIGHETHSASRRHLR